MKRIATKKKRRKKYEHKNKLISHLSPLSLSPSLFIV